MTQSRMMQAFMSNLYDLPSCIYKLLRMTAGAEAPVLSLNL